MRVRGDPAKRVPAKPREMRDLVKRMVRLCRNIEHRRRREAAQAIFSKARERARLEALLTEKQRQTMKELLGKPLPEFTGPGGPKRVPAFWPRLRDYGKFFGFLLTGK